MKKNCLNADIAEGFPFDEALLRLLSSANIACGLHAGGSKRNAKCGQSLDERKVRFALGLILVFQIEKTLGVLRWIYLIRN